MKVAAARAVLMAAVLLVPWSAARAETAADEADALLEEATRLFADAEDLDAARERFEASYRARPSWEALNGIAMIFAQVGRLVDAIDAYERLLDEFDEALTPEQKATVQRRIARLKDRVVVLRIEASQPGVTVRLDGEKLGEGPLDAQIYVLPGRHVISAELRGHRSVRRVIEGAAGKVHEFSLALSPEATRPPSTEPSPPKPADAPARTSGSWVGPTLMGVGAVAAAGGVFSFISAADDYEQFDENVKRESTGVPTPVEPDTSIRDRAATKRIAGFALVGVGAALVATGAVITLRSTGERGSRTQSLAIAPGLSSVRIVGQF